MSLVLRRTFLLVPDEDDGACSASGSTLMSDWREESQDELLVPMFLKALAAFFALRNILQKLLGTNKKTCGECEKQKLVVSCPKVSRPRVSRSRQILIGDFDSTSP